MLEWGERDSREIIRKMEGIIGKEKLAKIDYLSIVDGETLEAKEKLQGTILVALAVWIGKTRLIDNLLLEV